MSAGPPPGHPWHANIGNNPNINREPPPPPLNGGPAPPPPAAAGGGAAQVVVEQHHAPVYGPPLPIGIGGPAFGFAPPFGVGVGLGFGLHADGVPFPPPPPGAIAGVVPPFAPAAPLWVGGGLAFGNVPAVGGVVVPPPMGGMMMMPGGGASQHVRPAPPFHDGNHGFAAQPAQQEPSQIAGGIPAGVQLIESAEHSIFFRIKGNVCPWLSPAALLDLEPLAAASTTGLNRLIQICNGFPPADELENMAVTECIELGSGLWEKGQTFKYNDAVSRVLTMKDAGWDNTRNRTNGQSLFLWGHRV
ncbi:hypothetical protein BDW02DRAFT_308961 [Decorospora gaudefroyi]|uniref:Uncharacterized protein n=1 Tax=Decorospora gaudefroyi TaxID=184978 RepID=A0A6A5KNA0_9PLEO|nr:hypothetical protein BDW02DRAFT_308961 [Decorospora gaudefroyi]